MKKILALLTLVLLGAVFVQSDVIDLTRYVDGTFYNSVNDSLVADGFVDTVLVKDQLNKDEISATFSLSVDDTAYVRMDGSLDGINWLTLADSATYTASGIYTILYTNAEAFLYFRLWFNEATTDTLLENYWKVW